VQDSEISNPFKLSIAAPSSVWLGAAFCSSTRRFKSGQLKTSAL